MTNDHPTLSVVAPCFNEEGVLHELYRRICAVLEGAGESWELVLVNDGSRDRTPEIMRELHTADPRVKVLDFARNFGHQVAVTAGMDYARGDAVVLIDADLQDPPEVILDAKGRHGSRSSPLRLSTASSTASPTSTSRWTPATFG
jgi:glycosyltransferase involved in cell wall biosynthesis